MQLLDGMSAAGVTPDSSSFHGLMQACGKAKESGLIGDLIQEVRSHTQPGRQQWRREASVDPRSCWHVQMEAKKVPISPVTYSTAIAALARCGAWDKARDLLRQMHDKVGREGGRPLHACRPVAASKHHPCELPELQTGVGGRSGDVTAYALTWWLAGRGAERGVLPCRHVRVRQAGPWAVDGGHRPAQGDEGARTASHGAPPAPAKPVGWPQGCEADGVVWVWGQVEAYNEAIFACGKAHEVSSARACMQVWGAAGC